MNYIRNFLFFYIFNVMLFGDVFEGYVIFTPSMGGAGGNNTTTYLMNHNSDVVHTWQHDRPPASMPYLFPDSTIIYPYRVPSPTMNAGGVGGGISKLAWNGTTIWDHQFANNTYQHHHDVEPLPNGNVLIIVWEKKTATEAYELGRQTITNPLNQMWSETILELEPESGDIVWEWHLWDHLCQDVSSIYPNFVNVSEHPELFDINNGGVGSTGGPGGANADWMHVNAISYNAELDQIIISSRHMDEIFIIDHSTTTEEASGHTGGNSGIGGDFLYRWGNPQNYDRGSNSNHILDAQHGVNWIPTGYPGEGNLILFNNGHTNNSSAVLEFIPPINSDGTYEINGGQPFGPDDAVWIYSSGNSVQSDVQSGAFRLPNGNTLITEADDAYIFEVDLGGAIQWSYLHPGFDHMIARAQKYGLDYFDQNSEITISVEYNSDWNMVGLPLTTENSQYEIIFPESISGTLYSFSGGYNQEFELVEGIGYWLRFSQSGAVNITGASFENMVINLNSDWNLISGPSDVTPVSAILDPQDLLISGTIYGFDQGYVNVTELIPGKGYWLRSSGEGEVSFGNVSFAELPNNYTKKIKEENKIIIGNQTLYLDSEINVENLLRYSLPPKPPSGALDIRFAGDTRLCAADECVIEIMNDGPPLVLECDISDSEVWTLLDQNGNMFECESTNIFEISNETDTLLLRKSKSSQIPTEFILFPAYPNPFNPKTTVQFFLQTDMIVSLHIYNIAGELVENLVNKKLPQGNHNVHWNASGLSSGMYFIIFEGSGTKEIQKVLLMK